jgi:catechol 2,3-dioxygenase-like lactoylglutathione lyase family enzyme
MKMRFTLAVVLVLSACSKAPEAPLTDEGELNTALLRTALMVSDIDKSAHFYSYALGYETGFSGDITSQWVTDLLQLDAQQTVRFAILYGSDEMAGVDRSSAMIGLLEVANPPLPTVQRPEGHTVIAGEGVLAMVTSDIDLVHTKLMELGGTILFGPQESVSGVESELVFYDPDGIRVHVVERHEQGD